MSSSRASALRGASWFSHSALSTYCEAEGDGERFANGAGGRHDTVKVEEGRGSQRATVVKYALRCSLCSSLLLSSTAPWTCPERGSSAKNRNNGEELDDQCSWTGREDCTLGKPLPGGVVFRCSVVLLWTHLALPLPSPLSLLLCCSSAGVSCDVLHRRQPSGPPLGPQCTGTKEPSEESYGLACLSLVWCVLVPACARLARQGICRVLCKRRWETP